ncbi:MAG: hypothetical protein R3193_06425 [Marinobacter sp.]|nr:hypothetical protein [Marinobacter sp.]
MPHLSNRLLPLVLAVVAVLDPDCSLAQTPGTDESAEEEVFAGWEAAEPEADDDERLTWIDTSHAVATGRAQALTNWMDDYFGDPEYISEEPQSQLRLEFIDAYDGEDGNDFKVRVRGSLQLPKVSRRLRLVFSGEDSEFQSEEERSVEDEVKIQYKLGKGQLSRFDLSLGFASGHLRPGIKYRHSKAFSENLSYRFVERILYEDGENFFSQTQLDFDRSVGKDSVIRWGSRFLYGEKTEGVEWRTGLSLRQRFFADAARPLGVRYSMSVNGVTRPESFEKNYSAGVILRRQVYRDFLFFEVEPSYNYRRKEFEDERAGVFRIVFRLEIALQRDLARVKIDKAGKIEEPRAVNP